MAPETQTLIVDRFGAVDQDGNPYIILVTQKFKISFDHGMYVKRIPGKKYWHTLDGQLVRYIDDDNFELVETGIRLTKM